MKRRKLYRSIKRYFRFKIHRNISEYFRSKRMQQLWEELQLTPETRIVDVGGTPFNWSLLPARPQLILINLSIPKRHRNAPITFVVANGKYMPFRDKAFDIAYSNSVIEHLGSLENQALFAAECIRIGRRYCVQTPNKYFPIEPHLMAPFIHWLPHSIQRPLLRNFTPWGWIARPSRRRCEQWLSDTRLLAEDELRQIFPHCTIWPERIIGVTKSFLAVGNGC